MIRFWRRWLEDPNMLYGIVLVKTAIVVVGLVLLWALQGKDTVVVYMRF